MMIPETENPPKYVKKKISLIALDIDGVMNSVESFKEAKGNTATIYDLPAKKHIEQLNRIMDETGAYLLLSSTWRKHIGSHLMGSMLYLCGLSVENSMKFIGETPTLNSYRGIEILTYILSVNSKDASSWEKYHIDKLIIIDDDADMLFLSKYLVKTDNETGLTKEVADKAIEMLNSDLSKLDILNIDFNKLTRDVIEWA